MKLPMVLAPLLLKLMALEVKVAQAVPVWVWPGAGVLLASALETLQKAVPEMVVASCGGDKETKAARQGSKARRTCKVFQV